MDVATLSLAWEALLTVKMWALSPSGDSAPFVSHLIPSALF